MNLLIKGCTILPMTASESDPSKYFVGNVGIADGKIVFADADPATTEAFRARCGESLHEIDGQNKVAMPGFINLHNHVSMSLMRSYADDMPLMPWLNDKIWPFEAKLNGDDIYLGARLGIAEMLLGGTTTFVDMYWHSDRVEVWCVRHLSGPTTTILSRKRSGWPKNMDRSPDVSRSCWHRMPLIPVLQIP